MKRLDEVLAELGTVDRAEILTWLEASWVRAEPTDGDYGFRPVDIARAKLIQELRHELLIDQEAMPVVLSLLDEMYELRRRLAALTRALADAPQEVRGTVVRRCRLLLQDPEDPERPTRQPSSLRGS